MEAEIRVVEHLRGRAATTSIQYSTHWCCGSNLDIGGYYAAMLKDPKESFFGNPGNLLPMGESYSPNDSRVKKLRTVVAGNETLESAFGKFPSTAIDQLPPPPPPCLNVRPKSAT